jgi:hypothetical protein
MATNYSPTIVTDGAVFVGDALMPSTATSATKLYNRAGSSDGTMYNGACCDFDGTDDDIHTTSDITLSGACTVSVWISSDTSTQHIFSNKSGGPVNLRFGMDSGKMTYQYYSAAWRYLYSTSTIPLTTWTHLTWVRTADNFISFYINGVLDAGPTQALGSDGSASSSTVNGLVNIVGGYWSSSVFNGRMSDFKVFNTALSSAQVKQMYDDSKVIIPAGSQISSLDLWYSMAEGTGAIAYDGSGNKNSGVGQNFNNDEFLSGQTGAPQLITGYNRPMWFSNAGSDYVQATSTSTGPLANQNYTIAAWVNPAVSPPGADRGIFSYDFTSHANPYYAIQVRLLSTGKVFFSWNDGMTYRDLQTTGDITAANTWVHIACTHTSGSQKIYINGVENNSSTRTDTITFYNQEIWIGRTNYGAYFDGIINEVVVYDSVLTLAQVQALAATDANGGPLPPDPMSMSNSSNVVGYWRNDGNTTWTDRSSNSSNGTVYGSPSALLFKQGINGSKNVHTSRDNQGFPLLYQNNGAIGFDGVKDYVNITPALEWSVFPSVTVSLWMQTDFTGAINYAFFSWANSSNSGGLNMSVNSSGYFYVSYRDDAWSTGSYPTLTSTTSKVNDKKWHQCVFTYGGDPTIYLDGVANGTASRNSAMTNISSELTYIGHLANHAVGNYHFDGRVANLQVYNRALSYAEIKQNYNAQKSRFT